jgi:hypothetical protein
MPATNGWSAESKQEKMFAFDLRQDQSLSDAIDDLGRW